MGTAAPRHFTTVLVSALAALVFSACDSDVASRQEPPVTPTPGDDTPSDGTPPDPDVCTATPNDLMIVLDRTGSMALRPDGEETTRAVETKWYAVVNTIYDVVDSYEQQVNFGVTLFPEDPDDDGGVDCSNLETWLAQYEPPETTDDDVEGGKCMPAEVVVPTGRTTRAMVEDVVSVLDTGLCSYTPIGNGLSAAMDAYTTKGAATTPAATAPTRSVLLITDGADNCGPVVGGTLTTDPGALLAADDLAAEGIRTYVLGFDGAVGTIDAKLDPQHLNDLACAGGTAPDPDRNCRAVDTGLRAVADPDPAMLYLRADDQASLTSLMMQIAEDVSCPTKP
jgi:hypothetical protein